RGVLGHYPGNSTTVMGQASWSGVLNPHESRITSHESCGTAHPGRIDSTDIRGQDAWQGERSPKKGENNANSPDDSGCLLSRGRRRGTGRAGADEVGHADAVSGDGIPHAERQAFCG